MIHNYPDMLDAARHALIEAATVCRKIQGDSEKVRSVLKDDSSPITVADYASQAIISHFLEEALGPVHLVAEEDADDLRARIEVGSPALAQAVLDAVRLVWPGATMDQMLDAIDRGNAEPKRDDLQSFWTLDPVDGTKGFLRGQQYAISLAWIEHERVVIGALGCPNLSLNHGDDPNSVDPRGSLYLAIRGDGIWESHCDHDADGWGKDGHTLNRLQRDEYESISICASVEKEHSSVSDTDRVLQLLAQNGLATDEPVRLDSQAKYAVVARGQADAYLRLPARKAYVEKIWDHAAGVLIAGEAGSHVTDIFGYPLEFSHGVRLEMNTGIVCAPPQLHGKILGAIKELGIGREE
ncbi:MAG: 3'(2'),5'-bisphosphate nucleotidase [Phycisphaerales bacterium]